MFLRLLTDTNHFCWNKCHYGPFNSGAPRTVKVCVCLNLYGSNYIQLARRTTLVFENLPKLFLARTHEFLQYPFRTVALPFGYGNEYGKGCHWRALQADFTPTNRAFGKMNFFSLSSRRRIGKCSIKLSAISDSSVSSSRALFDSATFSTVAATPA